MTSFNPSDAPSEAGAGAGPVAAIGACPNCGGPTAWRAAHRFPIILQSVFGLSFVAFLMLVERIEPVYKWLWSGIQLALGVLLVRARMRANKRILICIRCSRVLR